VAAGDQAFVHVDLAGLQSAGVCGNVLPSVLVYVLRPSGWALLGSFETCGGLDPLSAVQVAVGDGGSDVLQFRVEVDGFGEFLSGVMSFEAVVRIGASSAPTYVPPTSGLPMQTSPPSSSAVPCVSASSVRLSVNSSSSRVVVAGDQAFVNVDLAGLPSAGVCGNVLPSVLVYVLRPSGWALLGSFETCGGLDPLSAVQVAVGDGGSDVLQFRAEVAAFGEFLSGVMSFEAFVRTDVPFLNGPSLNASSPGQTIVPNVSSTFPVSSINGTTPLMSNARVSGYTTYPGSSLPSNVSFETSHPSTSVSGATPSSPNELTTGGSLTTNSTTPGNTLFSTESSTSSVSSSNVTASSMSNAS
jgi:hypothetical protein